MANSDTSPKRQPLTNTSQLLETLAARRRALGLSQKELADKLGIHQSHLSDIEHGQRTLNVERLLELLNVLGLDLVVEHRKPATKREW